MTSPDARVYLLHIRDRCEELMQCASLREQGAVPVSVPFSAVCQNLAVIGEASSKIGAEFRAADPGIPWREMKDLRNVLIHDYASADPALVGVLSSAISRCFWRRCGHLLGEWQR